MPSADDLLAALSLERTGPGRYRAGNLDLGHGVVLGGQLMAQSLLAGLVGQEGKSVKTVHTVFNRGASPDAPVEIAVDLLHSGRSLASSTVTVSQRDRPCARSMVLLGADEPDVIRHADRPRDVPTPGELEVERSAMGAWEVAVVGGVDLNDPAAVGPPELDVWVRFSGVPGDEPGMTQALVGFITEGFLIGTAMRPHPGVGQAQAHRTLSTGVLGHTVTFHEPCDASEWLLISHWSPYAGHGRSYGRGEVFRSDRQLVASFVQDSMIRARVGGPGTL
jgi:acyl-CoA thioesterase II